MKDGAEGETGAGDEQRGRDTPQDTPLFMLRSSASLFVGRSARE